MENSNPYGNKFLPYLREDRLPHIFCPGCGNGTIMNAFIKGMEKAEGFWNWMFFKNSWLYGL